MAKTLALVLSLIAVCILSVAGIISIPAPEQIVTCEIIGPEGSRWTTKAIVGDSPITLQDTTGATWTIYIHSVETRTK